MTRRRAFYTLLDYAACLTMAGTVLEHRLRRFDLPDPRPPVYPPAPQGGEPTEGGFTIADGG